MTTRLTFEVLRDACQHAAAIRRTARMQPAGGKGDKVFPPTYQGGAYAKEVRVLEGARVPCVLLDSVQSQANRMEGALLDAHRQNRIKIPVVSVDFGAAGLPDVGEVTSLDAPHRFADAILRDSNYNDVAFRDSDLGKILDTASVKNATALFGVCPTALIFGLWDSAGPQGGLGTKFARALVSEIVAVDAETGVRPSSRIDPLAIRKDAGPVYEAKEGGWTIEESKAKQEKSKPKLWRKQGAPSELNHGNVVPSLTSEKGGANHGGVTFQYARQTAVISLAALRRLRFPNDAGACTATRDQAAHVALAALSLAAVVLGCADSDLRSRCALVVEEGARPSIEIVGSDGSIRTFTLTREEAEALLSDSVAEARRNGLPWHDQGYQLKPRAELVALVDKSRKNAVAQGTAEE
ncbi:MAG: type I-U CRISPR-associated protein Cas7 [Myxococcales bacterium]|nr:type I-U CRISPR-associated protein Cas7 [Myxococcales bacterium]